MGGMNYAGERTILLLFLRLRGAAREGTLCASDNIMKFLCLSAFLVLATTLHAQMKVASLHPLIGDIAAQVGGSHVDVVNLLRPGMDAHHFEPSASDLANIKGVRMVLASGKGLESYLDKLRDSVGKDAKVVEVGKTIPDRKIDPHEDLEHDDDEEAGKHEEHHHHGNQDPHWWHSLDNMKRAARVIADAFADADPANKDAYKANAAAAGKRIADLKSWAQQQFLTIPAEDRKLVTAHSAFGYFCKEFGFQSIPILGLAREDQVTPKYLIAAVKVIKAQKIRAVFPEDQANPKVLAEITRETGVKVGQPLIADGTSALATGYEGMIRHNVKAIVEALKR
jgi:zinc/manganese transport system substrate-binding protein